MQLDTLEVGLMVNDDRANLVLNWHVSGRVSVARAVVVCVHGSEHRGGNAVDCRGTGVKEAAKAQPTHAWPGDGWRSPGRDAGLDASDSSWLLFT